MMKILATRVAALLVCAAFSVLCSLPGCSNDTTCRSVCAEARSRCDQNKPPPATTCDEDCQQEECVVEAFDCVEEYRTFYASCPYDACATEVTPQVSSCPAYVEYTNCYNASYQSKTPAERQQILDKCPKPAK